eukprot:351251-Chlamydomonas_euryale.AAC.9
MHVAHAAALPPCSANAAIHTVHPLHEQYMSPMQLHSGHAVPVQPYTPYTPCMNNAWHPCSRTPLMRCPINHTQRLLPPPPQEPCITPVQPHSTMQRPCIRTHHSLA